MTHYPIHLNLAGRRCLIVGGGRVAERKAKALLDCGAEVHIVAMEKTSGLRALIEGGELVPRSREYRPEHLTGIFLAIAATNDRVVNAAVVRDARERGILVSSVDDPDSGDFITPAVVRRGDLMLTASTSGKSPTLAAVLAERLESAFGDEWAAWTQLFGILRDDIKAVPGGEAGRREMVRRILSDPDVANLVQCSNLSAAEARARQCL